MAKKINGTKKHHWLGIRSKILITFTIMALIPLLIIGAFTTLSINDLGDKSVDDSTAALKTQANNDLNTQTTDKAVQVEQFFKDIEADTTFLMEFANDVYNNPELIAFSNDSKIIAAVANNYNTNPRIEFWNVNKETMIYSLKSERCCIKAISFSPSGTILVITYYDDDVSFLDLN